MSKVEMSLQEYNKLMEELAMYKEIVTAVTTPKIDDWDFKWFNDHPDSILSISSVNLMESLSLQNREFLRQEIADNINRILDQYSIEGEINTANDYNCYLCSVKRTVEEVVEEV